MGTVGIGCTTLLLPLSVAQHFNLNVQPPADPNIMNLTLIADSECASLVLSEPPFTVQVTGLVRPNGTYDWNFQDLLDLKRPLPIWATNPREEHLLRPIPDQPLVTQVSTLEKGGRRSDKSKSSRYGIGYDSSMNTASSSQFQSSASTSDPISLQPSATPDIPLTTLKRSFQPYTRRVTLTIPTGRNFNNPYCTSNPTTY